MTNRIYCASTSAQAAISSGGAPETMAGRNNTLVELQQSYGGRLVEFSGHSTPVRYRDGIISEHLHARRAAGLFDVTHMNLVRVQGEGAAEALESLMPADLLSTAVGRLRYTVLTNDNGGIIDDLIIARVGEDAFELVTNACQATTVNSYLQQRLSEGVRLQLVEDQALLALQGAEARAVMQAMAPDVGALKPMRITAASLAGFDCSIACAGYTGDDGFECFVPQDYAVAVAEALLQHQQVRWCGLGARDSLRLEAGFVLYGRDVDESTTPVEAGLGWTIAKARRADGARPGGFPGAETIFEQLALPVSELDRKLCGVIGFEPGIAREGTPLYSRANDELEPIGHISSGGYSPSLKANIAMAWLPGSCAPGTAVYAKVRDRLIGYRCCELPFYSSRIKNP